MHAGTSGSSDVSNRTIFKQQQALSERHKQQPGRRRHQSVAMIVKNNPHCTYKKCPGLNIEKETTRTYKTNYRCEECSIDKGTNVWLCNTVKNVDGKQKKIECHKVSCWWRIHSHDYYWMYCYFWSDRWILILAIKLLPLFNGGSVDYLLTYFCSVQHNALLGCLCVLRSLLSFFFYHRKNTVLLRA
jgi:hypothetical protein